MTYSKETSEKKRSLVKYLRVPLRVVVRVGDLCVQSLTGNVVVYGNSMGCPTPHTPTHQRLNSPSPSPSPSNYRSGKTVVMSGCADHHLSRSKSAQAQAPAQPIELEAAVRRHASFGVIEKIDEEEEVEA